MLTESPPAVQAARPRNAPASRRRRVLALVARLRLDPCAFCGTTSIRREFHHLDAKRFRLADAGRYPMGTVRAELARTSLLCGVCHRAVHAGLIDGSNLRPIALGAGEGVVS